MFQNCKNENEAKKLFRRLALRLHPDAGGEGDLMVLLQESYETFLYYISTRDSGIFDPEVDITEDGYQNVYEPISINDPRIKIFDEIYAFAKTYDTFNTSFVDSVYEFAKRKGYVTAAQFNCLVDKYYCFEMQKANKKNEEKEKNEK